MPPSLGKQARRLKDSFSMGVSERRWTVDPGCSEGIIGRAQRAAKANQGLSRGEHRSVKSWAIYCRHSCTQSPKPAHEESWSVLCAPGPAHLLGSALDGWGELVVPPQSRCLWPAEARGVPKVTSVTQPLARPRPLSVVGRNSSTAFGGVLLEIEQ